MNPAKLNHLADLIEQLPSEEFDMADLISACGTPLCIAGWAAWLGLNQPKRLPEPGPRFTCCPIIEAACLYLEVEQDETSFVLNELFRGDYDRRESAGITTAEAAATLRSVALGEAVRW